MKKLLTLCMLICMFHPIYAQKQDDIYAFRYENTVMNRWDDVGKKIVVSTTQEDRSEKWLKFRLGHAVTGGWAYKILESNSDRTQKSKKASVNPGKTIHYVDKTDNEVFFFISDDDLKNLTVTGFVEDRIGTLDGYLIPVKMRFANHQGGDFDISQAVNIGLVVRLRLDRWGMLDRKSVDVILGANATTVPVNENTVPGVYTTSATTVALSPVAGINFRYQNFNFGLATGLDILTGKSRKAWVYRKSPWFGLTLSTSILNIATLGKDRSAN